MLCPGMKATARRTRTIGFRVVEIEAARLARLSVGAYVCRRAPATRRAEWKAGVGVAVRGELLMVAKMVPRRSGFGGVIDYCLDEKAEQWQEQEPQREEDSQIR